MSLKESESDTSDERASDLAWIDLNLYLFAPLARDGFDVKGRGAIHVNLNELLLRKNYEEGHPFHYHSQTHDFGERENAISEARQRIRLDNLMQHYDPTAEFLIVLHKYEHVSMHPIPFPNPEEMATEIRGAYVDAEAEERRARLTCTDFWARDFHLASPYPEIWRYHVE